MHGALNKLSPQPLTSKLTFIAVHFWAPTFKWGISIANIADFAKPPEKISYPQQVGKAKLPNQIKLYPCISDNIWTLVKVHYCIILVCLLFCMMISCCMHWTHLVKVQLGYYTGKPSVCGTCPLVLAIH